MQIYIRLKTGSKGPVHRIVLLSPHLFGYLSLHLQLSQCDMFFHGDIVLIGSNDIFCFTKSRANTSLFIYNYHNVTCFFMVYVGDIVLIGSNDTFLDHFVQTLANKFSIKYLSPLDHFLGIEVIPTPTGLFLSQHHHIQYLLTQFHMDGAKEIGIPSSYSVVLSPMDESLHVDPTSYRRLVGSLQYLAFTRPNVSFAMNKLSQFMYLPTQTHWKTLKRVLRYLKGTIHHGLFLNRSST
uniref:Reverse transcriptase Ty1/copia-type domain-containing protein n=1 Tax=Lactuca sativa TaxID=4236 RepID=A0A9R1X1H4_LACSA|nr:hypothetical protein LSAT_V11C800429780 [Lactuca sativa]